MRGQLHDLAEFSQGIKPCGTRWIWVSPIDRIVAYRSAAKQWLCKQRPLLGNARNNRTTMLWDPFLSYGFGKHASTTIGLLLETVFSIRSVQSSCKEDNWRNPVVYPCGGGVEYLHRDPASRRRRWKGKSQIWDSKIWSQVPRDLDPRKIAFARTTNTYKRQTRTLVRKGAPQEQDRNCHTSKKDLVVSPRWVLYSKTDWPADRRS
jgi:hypothetical protein